MSHRAALTLSIILTLVLAVGIVAGRDRLFMAEAAPNASSVSPVQTKTESTSKATEREANATGPRVIDIPLPSETTDGTSSRITTDESQPRGDRNTSHERDRYNENDHEEEDDD